MVIPSVGQDKHDIQAARRTPLRARLEPPLAYAGDDHGSPGRPVTPRGKPTRWTGWAKKSSHRVHHR